jgi:hypothetical protein
MCVHVCVGRVYHGCLACVSNVCVTMCNMCVASMFVQDVCVAVQAPVVCNACITSPQTMRCMSTTYVTELQLDSGVSGVFMRLMADTAVRVLCMFCIKQWVFVVMCLVKMVVIGFLCWQAYQPFKKIIVNNKVCTADGDGGCYTACSHARSYIVHISAHSI